MEKIKNISIIGLSYLTICGSIYYLVFFEAFNLNGFSYISFTDVIRSALYSITTEQYAYISGIIILFGVYWEGTSRMLQSSKVKILDEAKSWRVLFWLIIFAILYMLIANLLRSILMFKIFPITFFVLLSIKRLSFMERISKHPMITEFMRAFLIFIPLLCYVAAKVNSENILKSIKYQYIIRNNDNRIDTLKYISNSGSNFIFTDLNNKKVILLKSDTVTLYDKK